MAGRRVDWPTFWGALGFLVIGTGFATFGGWHLWVTWDFIVDAEPVQAIVLDAHESCDDDGCTWWPELSFTDSSGDTRVMRTQFGSSDYGFSEGSTITALHNPAFTYLRIPGFGNLWLFGAMFFGLGAFVAPIGAWLMAVMAFPRRGPQG